MKWKALLLIALVLCSITVGVGVAINALFIKPMEYTASSASKPPVLLDPIETDVPGGK